MEPARRPQHHHQPPYQHTATRKIPRSSEQSGPWGSVSAPSWTPRHFSERPGVLQTVQRAEFWGAILALQAYWPCHLGIDNLNVAGTVGRLLDRDSLVKPLPLVKDGDLLALVQYMIRTRGRETVQVTKV